MYIGTHGNIAEFETDHDLTPGEKETVTPTDILGKRTDASQAGIPPMNLAFIDACSTGTTNAFASAVLYPGSGSAVDRCEVGWKVEPWEDWTVPFNQAFWGALAAGDTVDEARTAGIKELKKDYLGSHKLPSSAVPSTYFAIYGDQQARLSGLYTGSTAKHYSEGGGPEWAHVTELDAPAGE